MRQLFKDYLIIVFIILVLLSLLPHSCWAWRVIDLTEVSLEYRSFLNSPRNPVIWPEVPKEGLDLTINSSIFTYGYWDNTIESYTVGSQFRSVAWSYSLGVRLTSFLEVFYKHRSEHLLDRSISTMPNFPIEDSVGIKIYLYNQNKDNSIF